VVDRVHVLASFKIYVSTFESDLETVPLNHHFGTHLCLARHEWMVLCSNRNVDMTDQLLSQ